MTAWSRITVVLIVRDAADVLPAALESVPAEAEIVVADGASRDATVEAARTRGARVIAQDLEAVRRAGGNFDVARNAAAEHATRPWVFFLDADERLSPELAREIGLLAEDTLHAAYRFPRRNLFWGGPVRLLGEDRQTRLVRKGKGRYSGSALHRSIEVDGSVGDLDGVLIHENVRAWVDVVRRFRQYVPVEAGNLRPAPGFGTVCATPWRMFRYYYVTNRAWKDGARGLIVSVVYAAYRFAIAWKARSRVPD
ncbi:glycosyltransferase family 2 protein [Candidatus Sumerlaeota bacterium]|nr:glycosyltransferase family 2 protein [Candidatus Sumerlaeota bacterium]